MSTTGRRFGSDDNYTDFDKTGHLTLNGEAVVYEDLTTTLAGVSARGASNIPTWAYPSGSVCGAWKFAYNKAEYLEFWIQMPHARKYGSEVESHVHWMSNGTDTGNVKFELVYTWANKDVVFPADTTVTKLVAAPGVANQHTYSDVADLDDTGKTLSSVLRCRIGRLGNDAQDTCTDDIFMLDFDLHIELDGFGSRGEYTK